MEPSEVLERPFIYTEVTEDIKVEVIPTFVPSRSNISASYYFFAYTVLITNHSALPCQLLRRHWIIRDGRGNEEHIRGEGVVGEQPVIHPGETYKYTSACPLSTPTGNMRGSFHMKQVNGHDFSIVIPVFFLRLPVH